ncbi:hypothetical protein A0H81_00366 [Grifola frondosa]|uniref:Methyltransferase ausD n=1 Tax=Grifola frondosa TaxID=5627 RepID=A0A1C7MQX0_GRIFR|nr:hypothetical protein A0H81_00366 [Grifola frondosa]
MPLDESFYSLDEKELEFMKSQTGIQDEIALKKHILKAQAGAYVIYPYPCIRRLLFTKLTLARVTPGYEQLLKIGKERHNAIFLDIGCCFGNDIRKAIADGFPIQNIVASDLRRDYWELGHKLFNSTSETFPVPFVAGDAFDPAHLEVVPLFHSPPDTPAPKLSELTSLNPLHGRVSAIHASSFFHLFEESEQLYLAKALAGLLSPEPGSIILGSHGARPEKGFRAEMLSLNWRGKQMFCHSPESWTELWDGQVFEKGTVKVEAKLYEVDRNDMPHVANARFWFMMWSVTRL